MMLFRLMIVLFLLVAYATPVWAEEQDNTPIDIAAEQISSENALSKITITTKDWLDGDTYYIRYTFTNPTDTHIKKKLELTTISYTPCYKVDFNEMVVQCTEDISQLIIPPYSSHAITISLQQINPAPFNELKSSTFYFDDGSYIYYFADDEQTESHFSLSPYIAPDGKVYLSIQNNSFFETITEVRNIRLYFNLFGQNITSLYAEPIPLNIKPQKAQKIYLAELADPIDKKILDYRYNVSMKINEVSHIYYDCKQSYSDMFSYQTIPEPPTSGTFAIPLKAHYHSSSPRSTFRVGSFYHDDSYLYAYVQIYSHSDQTISVPDAVYSMVLPYFDDISHYQVKRFYLRLPHDFSLAPDERKYFTFRIPLPTDFYKFEPNFYPFFYSESPNLSSQTLVPIEQSPLLIPQEDYAILEDALERETSPKTAAFH